MILREFGSFGSLMTADAASADASMIGKNFVSLIETASIELERSSAWGSGFSHLSTINDMAG